jgi:hypothetical protein
VIRQICKISHLPSDDRVAVLPSSVLQRGDVSGGQLSLGPLPSGCKRVGSLPLKTAEQHVFIPAFGENNELCFPRTVVWQASSSRRANTHLQRERERGGIFPRVNGVKF